jgi:CubicO group peptidase (beta-lactamase class C family)
MGQEAKRFKAGSAIAATLLLCGLAACVTSNPEPSGLTGPQFSATGPGMALYGDGAGGYPRADRTSWYPNPKNIVDGFSRADEIWTSRKVPKAAEPWPWQRVPEPRIVYEGAPEVGRGYFTLDQYLERNPTTGLLIAQGDTILVERYQYGRSDQHRFTSFSMAKTIAGLLVGLALSDGAITSLDDPAERYAPTLAGTEYGRTPLRHLLTMSSGVEFRETPDGTHPYIALLRSTVEQRTAGGVEALRQFNTRVAPAGRRWYYADSETYVLGMVMQGAIKRPLADYLAERIWQPMGAEADASWLIDASGLEAAQGFFNATLRDYARLGRLLAHGGRRDGRQLIPQAWLHEMAQAHFSGAQTGRWFGYGYQTWIFPDNDGSYALQGLGGQSIFVDPMRKLVMVHTAIRPSRDPGGAETVALWRRLKQQFNAPPR